MAYYSRDNCVSSGDQSGCSVDYSISAVKQLVDVWKANYASGASETRLITKDELTDNLGYNHASWNVTHWKVNPEYTPSWVYNSNYMYWTMSQYQDLTSDVWRVNYDGGLVNVNVTEYHGVVRPVITLSKTNLSS